MNDIGKDPGAIFTIFVVNTVVDNRKWEDALKGVYILRNFKKSIFFISFSESISFQKYSVKIS